jgi:hypothetical protein
MDPDQARSGPFLLGLVQHSSFLADLDVTLTACFDLYSAIKSAIGNTIVLIEILCKNVTVFQLSPEVITCNSNVVSDPDPVYPGRPNRDPVLHGSDPQHRFVQNTIPNYDHLSMKSCYTSPKILFIKICQLFYKKNNIRSIGVPVCTVYYCIRQSGVWCKRSHPIH